MKSASGYADPESTAELSWADRPTEELAVAPPRPVAPARPRRRRVPIGVLAILMLVVGLAAGVGAMLAFRGVADSSAAPRDSPGAASEPSPTSHVVIGILTAVSSRSVRVSSGSITGTYLVTPATRITRGNTVVSLRTLKVGEQVNVRFAFADSTSTALTAQTITVKAATVKPATVTHQRATPSPTPTAVARIPLRTTTNTAPAARATVAAPARGTTGFAGRTGASFGNRTVGGGFGGAGPGGR